MLEFLYKPDPPMRPALPIPTPDRRLHTWAERAVDHRGKPLTTPKGKPITPENTWGFMRVEDKADRRPVFDTTRRDEARALAEKAHGDALARRMAKVPKTGRRPLGLPAAKPALVTLPVAPRREPAPIRLTVEADGLIVVRRTVVGPRVVPVPVQESLPPTLYTVEDIDIEPEEVEVISSFEATLAVDSAREVVRELRGWRVFEEGVAGVNGSARWVELQVAKEKAAGADLKSINGKIGMLMRNHPELRERIDTLKRAHAQRGE